MTYPHTQPGVVDRFLQDLRQTVEDMTEESKAGVQGVKKSAGGSAPIYGMTAALPKGPINQMLCSYVDVVLEV